MRGIQKQGKKLCRLIDPHSVLSSLTGHGGPSSSSLSTSPISSSVIQNAITGLCSQSCVVLCDASSIIPYSPSSLPQRESFIYSPRRYNRTLQPGCPKWAISDDHNMHGSTGSYFGGVFRRPCTPCKRKYCLVRSSGTNRVDIPSRSSL